MQSLLQVQLFSATWHTGKWRARDLPEAIGAHVEWDEGGRRVLGSAAILPSGPEIVLNKRIRGTLLERPIVNHEGAHLIAGDLLGFSGNAWAERQCERNATYGSSLLAIPTASAVELVRRHASIRELSDYYEVPTPLVTMRGALAVLLGEVEGDRERARQQLAASRRSLEAWMARQARSI